MRLIDTENFSKVMQDYFIDMITHHKYNVDCVDCNADLQHLLDEQPTAYDVDKVVEELKELRKKDVCDYLDCDVCLYADKCGAVTDQSDNLKWDKAIEIVKHGVIFDDVCEWKGKEKEFIQNPHTKRLYSNEPSMKNIYCITCGKKIKVVE